MTLLLTKSDLIKKYPWCSELTWPCIETMYRIPLNSYLDCIYSLFYIHNELFNSWSHLFGAGLTIFIVCSRSHSFVMNIYLLTAVAVFACSAAYHTLCCHSKKVFRCVQCVDWGMISTLIFSSNLLSSYNELVLLKSRSHEYEFYFGVGIFLVYNAFNLLCLFFTCGTICHQDMTMLLGSSYSRRVSVYCVYASGVGIAWFLRLWITGSWPESGWGILTMYSCYSTVILCIYHIPERWMPVGLVDAFGASHGWFHLGVLGGVVSLYSTYSEHGPFLPN